MIACCGVDPFAKGVPYCECNTEKKRRFSCDCGEELDAHEWAWDHQGISSSTHLSRDNREVFFHPGYSSGTAVVRGNKPCVKGQYYYWEIKVLTPMYGTDVMVGVGTSKINLREPEVRFCSFLGSDEESWGFSYRGSIQHSGTYERYGPPFVQGSIVGIFLDMFRGTITFYLNRQSLGIAFKSLKVDELYPMVCSTAAQSGIRLIYSFSCTPSLQLLCLQTMGADTDLVKKFDMVPGFKSYLGKMYWWLMLPLRNYRESRAFNLLNIDDEKIAIEILDWDGTPLAELSFGPNLHPCCSSSGDQGSPSSATSITVEDENYPEGKYCKKLCITRDFMFF
ncbi:SPRY domain-containing SOCS box protein 3 isoform X2 [Anabrus simplex]|uniref:SPRY domain-containing SOCS box protein 3 isoform X2 n=1 Tax=Anabrus simplex TaxID=316456 RepID=UPI0034DD6AD6